MTIARPDKVGHCHYVWTSLVRLSLLGVEWIDLGLHQHTGEDQVLQTRCAPNK